MAAVAVLVVDDVHLAVVVHPQFAHNDIVHRGRHFTPRVVVARLREHHMCDSYGGHQNCNQGRK